MPDLDTPDLATLVAPLAEARVTIAVMVASADGRATIDGRVGELTGKADQQVLLGLRELASVVVVGGRTASIEGYRGLLDEQAQTRRRARGLSSEPELVVFTRSPGDLPTGATALTAPLAADGQPDLHWAWQQLRSRHNKGPIVCEGGPTLLGLLVEQRLLDQLLLAISPRLVGGQHDKRLLETAQTLPDAPLPLHILDIASAGGFVFVRYGLS